MSLGYAEKLSYRDDLGGQLGAKELFDDPDTFHRNVDELAELVSAEFTVTSSEKRLSVQVPESSACTQVRQAKRIVVFTGAGMASFS